MIPSKALRVISNGAIIRHLKNEEGEFLKALAKELMLDELLCGEASPVEFLISSMERVNNEDIKKNLEKRIEQLNRK